MIDCDDLNCDLDPVCGGAGGENCGNNIDDDGDGAIDCDDILCLFDVLCWLLDERCADGMDNDLDGAVDCADVDCASDPACNPESCNNGVDDDGDGFVDCADSECAMAPACVTEDCDNGSDEDGDGLVDCADPECSADPVCLSENCSNGVDDDADGFTDCQDFECWGDPVCTGATENCSNDIDDNGNGLIDCADPTCSSDPACLPEICWNGTDDDGDLFADCDDDECFADPNCTGETCWNGIDDDGDGLIDCDDDECSSWPSCDSEICDNNVDDDGDGDVDCADIGCATFSGCTSEVCDNNLDDDGDGAVDCGDADCVGDPACISTSEQCNNNVDDDGDGQIDCDDSDCDGLPACAEDCSNGTDDDGDGDTDCDDSDCTGVLGCGTEDCTNDLDDDGDGWIDCGDLADCDLDPACIPEICGNGADDDGDGDIDCEDSECAGDDPSCGEVCDNGVDDDGDGEIDCDDQADCAMDEDCESTVGGTCVEQVELDCGEGASGTNWGMGSADAIDVYGCSSWIEDGPEYTYVFRPEFTEQVTVCLSNESDETDIFIIEEAGGCDGNNCIEVATECATFDAVAGEQYYFVVDGYEGAMGSFDIDVTCPSTAEICDNGVDDDANGVADCDDAACSDTLDCVEICQESWVLLCGSLDSFSTASPLATNQVDSYSCSPWEETGPEYAYYFQAPLDQANDVTIDLSYNSGLVDLDLFVLEDQGIPCNSESCVSYGGLGTTFETQAGADYWIVVDGYQGDAGAYEIFVDCEPVPDAEICDDGIDNDGDGDIDCDDEDCAGANNCAAYCDENAPTISCDQTVSGDNSWDPSVTIPGLTDSIDGYPCNIGSYTGPEMAYEWVATVTGTVEASFISPQPTVLNHDIIVLDGDNGDCVNTQCVPDGQGFNDVEVEAVAGHTYYFVVDAFEGEEGPFQLHLDCSP